MINGPDAARGMRDLALAEAPASEAARTLTAPLVDALWTSGLYTWMNVPEAGGDQPSFADVIEAWIELAAHDGSLGWTAMANMSSTMATSAFLDDDGFRHVFAGAAAAQARRVTIGGQFFPNGTAVDEGDHFRLTGAWNFGSGTGHSEFIAAGFFPMVNGEATFDIQAAIIPRADVEFRDGWHVQGLRGTGSYDYAVTNSIVPKSHTFPLFKKVPERGTGPLFQMGLMPITAAGHAGWALGVARSMLDDVAALAHTKARMSDMEPLVRRTTFQRSFGHYTGMWRSARAGVLEEFCGAEADVAAGDGLSPKRRAGMRIAACYATDACREIAQWAHLAIGTTAIREGSRIERAFRDIYTGTQHAFISEKVSIDAAQVLLGLEDDKLGL